MVGRGQFFRITGVALGFWAVSTFAHASPLSLIIGGEEVGERCSNPRGGSGLSLCTEGSGVFPHGELFQVLETLAVPVARQDRSSKRLRAKIQSAWTPRAVAQLQGVRLFCTTSNEWNYGRIKSTRARLVVTGEIQRSVWLEIPCTWDADAGNAAFVEALRVLDAQACPVDSTWIRSFFARNLSAGDIREVVCGGITLSMQRWNSVYSTAHEIEQPEPSLWAQWDRRFQTREFREHFAREMPKFIEERLHCSDEDEPAFCAQQRTELWLYLEHRGCQLDTKWHAVCEESFLSKEQWQMFYGQALDKVSATLSDMTDLELADVDPRILLQSVPQKSWTRALTIGGEARIWIAPGLCQAGGCGTPGFSQGTVGHCREDVFCSALVSQFVSEFLKERAAGCYRLDPQSTPMDLRVIQAPDSECGL